MSATATERFQDGRDGQVEAATQPPPHVDRGQIVGADDDGGRRITTGELRARLQRIICVKLTEPVEGLDGQEHFKKGDLVACQYWGNGMISVTPVHLEGGPPIMCLATKIRQPVLYS